MKKFLYLLLFLFLLIVGVTFTIQNPQEVYIQYYLSLSWRGPIALLLLATFSIGVVIGIFISFVRKLGRRKRYIREKK